MLSSTSGNACPSPCNRCLSCADGHVSPPSDRASFSWGAYPSPVLYFMVVRGQLQAALLQAARQPEGLWRTDDSERLRAASQLRLRRGRAPLQLRVPAASSMEDEPLQYAGSVDLARGTEPYSYASPDGQQVDAFGQGSSSSSSNARKRSAADLDTTMPWLSSGKLARTAADALQAEQQLPFLLTA